MSKTNKKIQFKALETEWMHACVTAARHPPSSPKMPWTPSIVLKRIQRAKCPREETAHTLSQHKWILSAIS